MLVPGRAHARSQAAVLGHRPAQAVPDVAAGSSPAAERFPQPLRACGRQAAGLTTVAVRPMSGPSQAEDRMTLPDHIVRKLNLEAELEQAIDAHGLEHVVELTAGICFAKCEHIKHN